MDKAIIFGASRNDKRTHDLVRERYVIILYSDNDKTKWGTEIDGILVIPPEKIREQDYDKIVIASITATYSIRQQLIGYGVEPSDIDTSYMDLQIRARECFLSDFASIVYKSKMQGNVAEAGVFQEDYAKVINRNFFDRKLYLFDTFEGFDNRDIIYEEKFKFSSEQIGHLNMTSENMVIQKMMYPQNCIVKKGYFPETAKGIDDSFCFVNLDMDLYKPTLEGLLFFWDKMEMGGIILVHDYFSDAYKGVENAVDEFVRKTRNVYLFPIGDSISVGLMRTC